MTLERTRVIIRSDATEARFVPRPLSGPDSLCRTVNERQLSPPPRGDFHRAVAAMLVPRAHAA